jgi:DNA-binding NarL/FixJ family response regulator
LTQLLTMSTQSPCLSESPCLKFDKLVRAERISAREKQVLSLLVLGSDDKTIARELCVSYRTVRSHISALFGKLRAHNRTELALIGLFSHLRTCELCRNSIGFEPD